MHKRPNKIVITKNEGDTFTKHKINQLNIDILKEKFRIARDQEEEDNRKEQEERETGMRENAEIEAREELRRQGYNFDTEKLYENCNQEEAY